MNKLSFHNKVIGVPVPISLPILIGQIGDSSLKNHHYHSMIIIIIVHYVKSFKQLVIIYKKCMQVYILFVIACTLSKLS